MREIKFRAKAGLRWCYGEFYHSERNDPVIYEPQSRGKTLEGIPYDGWRLKVDPETIGQYTGLTDANRQDIYEGDVVAFSDYDGTTHKGKVYFRDGAFFVTQPGMEYGYRLYALVKLYYPAFVIGNVHDDPQLLKEGGGNA